MRSFKLFSAILIGLMSIATTSLAATSDKVTCRIETDRSVLVAGQEQEVILKVTLDAPNAPGHAERPKVNVALVLDRSGSMAGSKLRMAKEAAIEALARLDADDIFSLVTYDNAIDSLVPAQKVKSINPIVRTINQIQPGGNTALFGGVSQGAAEIRKNLDGEYIHRVILLSDGIANVGPSSPEDLGRLGAALFKEHISVSTVGVGTDYNEDLMARLSQKSDGNTYFAEGGVDLPRIFAAELGEVLNVVAQKVTISISLAEGVVPLEIIGREGRIKGNRIELAMNQLYGGQEKFALVKVRLPSTDSGVALKIATARTSYYDTYAQQEQNSSSVAMANFSTDIEAVKASTNVPVVRDYQLNLKALAQEKAIELSDQGKPEAAAQQLRDSAVELKSMGSMYRDEVMVQEAAAVEEQALQLEREGMSKARRKSLRTESYQTKNQQIAK